IEKAREHLAEVESLGGMAKAIEAGLPKRRIEASAARTQARIDNGQQTILGVNKLPPTEPDDIPILQVDNSAVREAQIAQLRALRAARDEVVLSGRLKAITKAADSGDGNLLALAIDAARAKATVGEISLALEKVYGRHQAAPEVVSGVYKGAGGVNEQQLAGLEARIEAFA
ncbi:MAG TPA: methylmalonyl-CoA mutase, partial [Deltaproteobacteria bacterium]|nr:methylmalonyl-CoA mutase [Deltaproteobacteria bacterium]